MLSFVIYFHSARLDNLLQTMRFLDRETIPHEIVLVCQDQCDLLGAHNLRLPSYHKTYMCNFGVKQAQYPVVALLDSDRICPPQYFSQLSVKPRQFISLDQLYFLPRPYTDAEIETGNVEKIPDFKARGYEARRRNLFSGNTAFLKEDYLAAGGMDESFVGYGFADNDMTYNVISKGYEVIWKEGIELHLHHQPDIHFNGRIYQRQEMKIMTTANGIKFFKKWKLPYDKQMLEMIADVRKNVHLYPREFRHLFDVKFI